MTQPLALLLYEKLLPGTQLMNRLQDLGWRVQTLHEHGDLPRAAEEHKPVLIFADVAVNSDRVSHGIAELRRNQQTAHIPVIAFGGDAPAHAATVKAGATLVVSDAAVLQHLGQFIDQALSEF
jgi:DNA-binding NarL/FixJ family response regulator